MSHYVYLETEGETIHLAEFDAFYRVGATSASTLCGRPATGLSVLDETASGFASTCGSCRRAAGLPKR